jgi:hypothetical protein
MPGQQNWAAQFGTARQADAMPGMKAAVQQVDFPQCQLLNLIFNTFKQNVM